MNTDVLYFYRVRIIIIPSSHLNIDWFIILKLCISVLLYMYLFMHVFFAIPLDCSSASTCTLTPDLTHTLHTLLAIDYLCCVVSVSLPPSRPPNPATSPTGRVSNVKKTKG